MPRPSITKIASVEAADCDSAKPSAAPMNGAVQGEATTTASTPEPKASSVRLLLVHPRHAAGASWPNSNTPARLSPSAKNRTASAVTTTGDCSWNPQPSSCPAARSASSIMASSTNVTMTPAANASASRRIVARSSWRVAKPSTLSDSTGKTQGMRLRIMPPTNAKSAASASVIVSLATGAATSSASGAAAASTGLGPATTAPASGTSMVAARAPPNPAPLAASSPFTRVKPLSSCHATGSMST